MAADVVVTGGTGYLGRPLIVALVARGVPITALVRAGSEGRVPTGARAVTTNPLDAMSVAAALAAGTTLVHLLGTPRPNPSKAQEFVDVDLASIRAASEAAARVGIRHLVYVSVAHPAPVMKAYIEVRRAGEELVTSSGIPATILRPWYVLGPGHWWPYALTPLYLILERVPRTREGAKRLGLVTRRQMVAALVRAVESPPAIGVRTINVENIRKGV